MSIRDSLRQMLRRYGRAAVVTVHERLNAIDERLNASDYQHAELANTQTALLQAHIHLLAALSTADATRELEYSGIEAALERLAHLGETTLGAVAALESVAHQTSEFLADQSVRQVCVETADYASANPEVGLMAFLYSHLPGRNAIDIGAHTGEVSQYLLNAGFEVYAFEPYPPTYARLTQRMNGGPGFHPFQLALGSASGKAALHLVTRSTDASPDDDPTVFHSLVPHGMPAGLTFADSVLVPLETLADLHHDGLVPTDVSLVKIDTEGYDLEVIRGMGDHCYAVVIVEFWDAQIPFATQGLEYTLETMVGEMRGRGYFWYLVLYHVWGQNQTAFFCNHDRPLPNSWGNIFFFRERDTFAQAQQWCSATLPRTYFKPVAWSTPHP